MIDDLDCRAALADCFLDLGDSCIRNQAYDDALKYIDLAISFFIAQNRDLSSSRIEASLRAIANLLPAEKEKANAKPIDPSRKPVCLHVLKEAFAFGGHTAMATRWMKLDSDDRIHSVVLLDQQLSPPDELVKAVSESGGEIFIADRELAPLRQAAWLRELARNLAAYVILHVDTSNLIASVAFGKEVGPPVLMVNHAAHIFWVGVSMPDVIVNCLGARLEEDWTKIHRGANNCATIPIPLLEARTFAQAEPDLRERKSRAREIIGVPRESILIMTVGASYKYKPLGKIDFLKTCQDILEAVPDAFILAAGVIEDDRWRDASNKLGFRLRALGSLSQSEIALLHQASDLYIEGFPIGSVTALLESGLQGLPVVLAPAECPPPYSSDGVALDDTLERPDSLNRYKLEVVRLCGNPAERISAGLRLRNAILAHHTGAGWKRYLTTALQALPPGRRVYPIQAPVRTPPAIYEYWSEFEKTRSQNMSIQILEEQIFRAFSFGLRPKITPEMKRAWRNARRFRTGGVIPLHFLSLLCNYCLPLLPLPLARIIFRIVKFFFRGGLLGRAREKAGRMFRRADDSQSPEGQYRYLPEQSQWLSGPTISARNTE
ncbi:MAG: hypothetical protein MOB07_18955 [Acidobacteria bacterium]|nr:hypothetical protein [Acidobacteriota bacterium]